MRPFPSILALTLLTLPLGMTGATSQEQARGGTPTLTQQAEMVLSHPHDKHVFKELPPKLERVPGAVARLTRERDRVTGTLETTLTPRHVGKLLAVVINNPAACKVPTPATACGPHEEEFNKEADGGFFLGDGAVADRDGRIRVSITVGVDDTSDRLCAGAANPDFNPCATGFTLRDPRRAEVTLVLLDNGPASEDAAVRARQLASPSPCPTCPPFTAQIAIGFGNSKAREAGTDR